MKPLALQGRQVHDILYKAPLNQLPGEKLNVGFTTRATLNRLLEAGDITPQEVQLFRQAALAFLVRAEQDKVSEEFLEYQLMDIPMPQDPTTFNVEEFLEEYVLNQEQNPEGD
ncbi:unnamed protein product [Merluccius merluccius]